MNYRLLKAGLWYAAVIEYVSWFLVCTHNDSQSLKAHACMYVAEVLYPSMCDVVATCALSTWTDSSSQNPILYRM